MKQDDKYFYWNKGEDISFNQYFSTAEFSCHCDNPSCVAQKISKTCINKLTQLRLKVKKPIIVTSAFRCSLYQKHLANIGVNTVVAKLSQHELGEAVDVICRGLNISKFLEAAAEFFESIGIAATFLHLDTRTGKRRWNY